MTWLNLGIIVAGFSVFVAVATTVCERIPRRTFVKKRNLHDSIWTIGG